VNQPDAPICAHSIETYKKTKNPKANVIGMESFQDGFQRNYRLCNDEYLGRLNLGLDKLDDSGVPKCFEFL
jgi:hypothetical protein